MSRTPKLLVYSDASGRWRWRLRTASTRVVCDSAEGYKTRRGAVHAIDALYRLLYAAEIIVMPDKARKIKMPKLVP